MPTHLLSVTLLVLASLAFCIGCRDLDAAYLRLCARGIAVDTPVAAHYGMQQRRLCDPGGCGVCLPWRVA
ncbi:hypothetical protein DFR29_118114 [Tahibacter aquaticus]|uniref:Uncharacterized protein n=1 Tax=Tahibacter aquaticus TaxID=520092 RepID=A0A4R6YNB5_9GAMM|nr:hypothetical protein [Tahibacter aquaticus]TDR38971.1 hypothetical protein DFR29_118114 [Tahibacter aquaticus]